MIAVDRIMGVMPVEQGIIKTHFQRYGFYCLNARELYIYILIEITKDLPAVCEVLFPSPIVKSLYRTIRIQVYFLIIL